MKLHLIETIDGPQWVAIVGAAITKPSPWRSVAVCRGVYLEAAIAAAHVRRAGR